MVSFRFKLWWMAQRMGKYDRDVLTGTKFLLLKSENEDSEIVYTVFLLIVEGPFRASLQGRPNDELLLCIESGDETIASSAFLCAASSDPVATITRVIKAVEAHLNTFHHGDEKKLPDILDYLLSMETCIRTVDVR